MLYVNPSLLQLPEGLPITLLRVKEDNWGERE